jgi:NAD(P)-dependent dehydrogenase (short-subunit alcohol dehydrogenase family)
MKVPAHRVALVTGAAHRIGRAIALALGARGFAVAIHYRSAAEAAQEVAREVRMHGGTAETFAADLAAPAEVDGLIDRVTAALGSVTCLVNNASAFDHDTFGTMTREGFARHLETNLTSPLFLGRRMADRLPAERSGVIVNITDQRVWRPTPDFFTYSLSKHALWEATRLMAQALAPRIRVNAIGPGPVLQSVHQTPAEFEAEARSTLLGRGATPEEIAAGVGFILDAPAMTGQMIALDGGQHLVWRD